MEKPKGKRKIKDVNGPKSEVTDVVSGCNTLMIRPTN